MKTSNYIAQYLVDAGITEVFSVTGGAAMHLNDSFGKHPALRVTYCAHENSCVTAAESYFRLTGKLACVVVTAGPGSLNCVTGIHGAFTDSMGVLVLSGQCDSRTINQDGRLRQLGDQSVDICPIVQDITKYAEEVCEPLAIKAHLHNAIYLAKSRRPGPTWLSIPVDIQGAEIDPERLRPIVPPWEEKLPAVDYEGLVSRLSMAKRPVILAGSGIRTAGAVEEFLALVDILGIPVVTAFNAHDLLPSDHPCYVGRQGTIGDMAGNLAVQESDLLLILGSRMNIRSIGFNFEAFAPKAYRVMVDVDRAELEKPFPRIDMGIHADLKAFLSGIFPRLAPPSPGYLCIDWVQRCLEWKRQYPVVKPEYHDTPRLNPYVFIEDLFDQLCEDDVIVTANGTACVATFQAAHIKEGQRLYTNGGSAAMGWGLPAAIGASCGAYGRRIIVIEGDGSLMMSSQELTTISYNKLPIKIFILSNNGYSSIKQTQARAFPDSPTGFSPETGVGFPDLKSLAAAYGLPYGCVHKYQGFNLDSMIGPHLIEVVVDPNAVFAPRIRFPLEEA